MIWFKTPIKNILGLVYYRYELTASDNNPKVGDTITLYCKVTNVFGKPIKNKYVELYMNNELIGETITNEDGIATWTNTFADSGVKDFWVNTVHCTVFVSAFKVLYTENGLTWTINQATGLSNVTYYNSSTNLTINADSFITLKDAYASDSTNVKYCPHGHHVALTNKNGLELHITYLGEIRIYNRTSSNYTGKPQGVTVFVGKGYIKG